MKNLKIMLMLSVASLSLAPVSYGMEEDYMVLDLNHYKESIFSEEFNFERGFLTLPPDPMTASPKFGYRNQV